MIGRQAMTIHRRDFLVSGAALAATATLPRAAFAQAAFAQAAFAPKPGSWRTFEIVTRLEVANQNGPAQAWIPVPSVNEADWFKTLDNKWTPTASAALARVPKSGAAMVHVEWPASEQNPAVEIPSHISTRDRAIDLTKPGKAAQLSAAERTLYTGATTHIPTDGIVKETSDMIVAGAAAASDIEKARAI